MSLLLFKLVLFTKVVFGGEGGFNPLALVCSPASLVISKMII